METTASEPRTDRYTIVVGVDGSEPSLRAWRTAVEIATRFPDAEVIATFARYVYLAGPRGMDEAMFDDVLQATEHEARRDATRIVGERPLQWRFETHDGEPSSVLREVAQSTNVKLLVCGRSGWSTVHELIVGSVSNRLVHDAPCPIVLVP